MRLAGKVAIITGASKGIGKGIAIRYAKEGASVVLASRSMDLLSSIVDQIQKEGGKALALEVDVCRYESVESMVTQSIKQFGRLDIMVNNAGISMAYPSEELSPRDWQRALDTDLSGVFYGCQCAARRMIPQGEAASSTSHRFTVSWLLPAGCLLLQQGCCQYADQGLGY